MLPRRLSCKKGSYPEGRPLEFAPVMPNNALFGLFAACCLLTSAGAGESMKIVLKNGAELRGEVLKEREDAVILDLGHTVLTLPRSDISLFEKALATTNWARMTAGI